MRAGWWMTAAVLGMAGTACAQEATQPSEHHVRMSLVFEKSHVIPGQTFYLGIVFEIDKDWHLYWDGQNDSGMPIGIETTLAEGFEAQELQWPAPVRHVYPGGIIDYVYFDRVTLFLPVKAPDKAAGRTDVAFTVKTKLMVCKEICVLEEATSTLTVPVGSAQTAKDSPQAPLMAKARARMPKPLPTERSAKAIVARIDADRVIIDAPESKGLTFFPRSGGPLIVNPIQDATTEGKRLLMTFEHSAASAEDPLRGILEVRHGKGVQPEFFSIELKPGAVENPVKQ